MPHDTQSLIRRLGGDRGFVAWLDGVMWSHYDSSNEPSLLAPYLYIHAGRRRPDRCQTCGRCSIASTPPDRGGLPGNDDAGALSAWYVWGAIGLYPNAGQHVRHYIGSPIFRRSRIQVGRKAFTRSLHPRRPRPTRM